MAAQTPSQTSSQIPSQTLLHTQAAEHGQLTRRAIIPQYQAHLDVQRTVLIDNLEHRAVARGWTERPYRAYTRLVFIERGQQLPNWEEYIESWLAADDAAAAENRERGEGEEIGIETSVMEDDSTDEEGEGEDGGEEEEEEEENSGESEFLDMELEDLQRLLAAASENDEEEEEEEEEEDE